MPARARRRTPRAMGRGGCRRGRARGRRRWPPRGAPREFALLVAIRSFLRTHRGAGSREGRGLASCRPGRAGDPQAGTWEGWGPAGCRPGGGQASSHFWSLSGHFCERTSEAGAREGRGPASWRPEGPMPRKLPPGGTRPSRHGPGRLWPWREGRVCGGCGGCARGRHGGAPGVTRIRDGSRTSSQTCRELRSFSRVVQHRPTRCRL
jgi:hypothetical protein